MIKWVCKLFCKTKIQEPILKPKTEEFEFSREFKVKAYRYFRNKKQ